MKKILVAFVFGLLSITAFAEASFDEIQGLINSKNYAAAEAGLEVIIKNHPQSAKAFYAMAEAQAGLGNLEKANKALNLAKGIDPTLKFVSEGSVRSLEQAITPQTAKITYEEPSHFWRNFTIFVMFCIFGWACYFFWCVYNRKKDDDEGPIRSSGTPKDPSPITPNKPSGFTDPIRATSSSTPSATSYTPRPTYTPTPTYSAPPTTTVVNNSSGSDLLTGMVIGNMLSGSHHDHTTVIEREVVREKSSRDSSWDDSSSRSSSSSSSSRSSSWDDDSSSSKSSSWDDSSSSSRSSSWDSDSSSSSSSSWDSGSSSSSSSDW